MGCQSYINFHLAVTYVQFPLQVCFSPRPGQPTQQLLSPRFHSVTLNPASDLDLRIRPWYCQDKPMHQISRPESFSSKVSVHTHADRHTHPTNCYIWTSKVVVKIYLDDRRCTWGHVLLFFYRCHRYNRRTPRAVTYNAVSYTQSQCHLVINMPSDLRLN